MLRGLLVAVGLGLGLDLAYAQAPEIADIERRVEALRRQVEALPRVDLYTRAEIDSRLEAIARALKTVEMRSYSQSEVDTKLSAVEKVAEGRLKTELDPIRDKLKSEGAIPWSLLISAAGFLLSLVAFWRTQQTRAEDKAKAEVDRRVALARKVVDEWGEWTKGDKVAHVHFVLEQPAKLADATHGAENRNKVLALGVWMNRVATDWLRGDLDASVARTHGIDQMLKTFWNLLEGAKAKPGVAPEVVQEIEQRQREWTRLKEFIGT